MKLVRARWWGAAAGVVLAVVDTLTISALGVRFEMNGHHVSPLVGVWFGSSFALLGFLAAGEEHERHARPLRRLAHGELKALERPAGLDPLVDDALELFVGDRRRLYDLVLDHPRLSSRAASLA